MGNRSKRVIKTQTKPFDLDTIEKEALEEGNAKKFKFTLGGRDWALPPFGTINRKALTNMDPNDPASMMLMFKIAMGDEDFKDFNELELSIDGLNALEAAWTEHSGISAGE